MTSIVIKHRLPPITFDTGSARNTPCVPMCNAYGIRYVSGTTIITFTKQEKILPASFYLMI